MTAALSQSLAAQRETLRAQLVAQRQLIARQLDLSGDSSYPRSSTMRFLKRSTVPAATAIGGVATILGGLRFLSIDCWGVGRYWNNAFPVKQVAVRASASGNAAK